MRMILVKKKSDSRSHIALSKEKVFPSIKNPLKFSIFFYRFRGFLKKKFINEIFSKNNYNISDRIGREVVIKLGGFTIISVPNILDFYHVYQKVS